MTTNHEDLFDRLQYVTIHTDLLWRDTLREAKTLIEQQAARIQQQAARIAELEKEQDALKADARRWREFAEHQTWCADCADSVSTCPIGSRLREATLQAEKEMRS